MALGACAGFQFGREGGVERIPFLAIWAIVLVVMVIDAAIVALIPGSVVASVVAAVRSLAESAAFIALTVAGAFAIQTGSRKLGIGHWPPRDGVFAQQFQDRRAEWSDVRDGVLREARATGSDLSRDVVDQIDPRQEGARYIWKERFRELGIADAKAAWDGRWVRLALWEGDYHFSPIGEKGLLFVDRALAGEPEARLVDRIAVEDLGDGWYVFEE